MLFSAHQHILYLAQLLLQLTIHPGADLIRALGHLCFSGIVEAGEGWCDTTPHILHRNIVI